MRSSTLIETLASIIPTGQAIYLWGKPGVGKSSVVAQTAAKLGISLIDVRAVLLDPVDLRGLPHLVDGVAKWATPDFLPREGKGLLFLDELGKAPPLVQSALLQLVLDRRIGEYVLPDGWFIVAASNRVEDRSGDHRMNLALQNRFLHLDLEADADDWQAWALTANIAPEVRSFIRARPNLLHSFDPQANQRSFPTPRSWEFVSRVLPNTNDANIYSVVSGCVGEGAAAEFVAFAKVYRSLPDIDVIFKSPATAPVPSEPDVLYAVCGAVAEGCRRADKAKLSAAVQYANRMPREFAVLLIRDVARVNAAVLTTPEGAAWLKANRHALAA